MRLSDNSKTVILNLFTPFVRERGRGVAWSTYLPWAQVIVGPNPTDPTVCENYIVSAKAIVDDSGVSIFPGCLRKYV
jgi:hypothetical protein